MTRKHAATYREMAERYQGWANRETWHVSLWLNNDEELYNTARNLVSLTPDEYAAREVMQEYVEGLVLGDEPPANLATDLLTYALARVDWREIVEAFRED